MSDAETKPKRDTRFAPGVSGNPRGRPKASRKLTAFEKAMNERFPIQIGGRTVKLRLIDILYKQLGRAALSGDNFAMGQVNKLHIANGTDPVEKALIVQDTVRPITIIAVPPDWRAESADEEG